MTLEQTKKLAQHICRLLKVTYINLPIGRTDKGNFGLIFNENGDWDMMLDSVPLSTKNVLTDENNIELKRMVEKYWFEQEKIPNFQEHTVERYEEATAFADKMMKQLAPKKKELIETYFENKPVSPAKKHGNTKTKGNSK